MEIKKVRYTLKGKRYTITNYVFDKGEDIKLMKPLKEKRDEVKQEK